MASLAPISCIKEYRLIPLSVISFPTFQAPMFSFTRLRGADPTLGVEMSSTGEVACFGYDSHEAFLQSMLSTGFKLPTRTRTILLSIASEEFRSEFLDAARILAKLGYNLVGTPGTARYYNESGLSIVTVTKPVNEEDIEQCAATGASSALKEIHDGHIDMVINISEGTNRRDEITSGYVIRRAAVDFDVSLITNVKCAVKLVECLDRGYDTFRPKHIGQFYKMPTIGWSKK